MSADETVHPTAVTAWQLIAAAISVMGVMGLSLWTIVTDQNAANDKLAVEFRTGYVNKSQHQDLADRLTREVGRVDDLGKVMLPRAEFDRWNTEHERALAALKKRLDVLEQNYVTNKEFENVVNERGKQIDSIRSRLDSLFMQKINNNNEGVKR